MVSGGAGGRWWRWKVWAAMIFDWDISLFSCDVGRLLRRDWIFFLDGDERDRFEWASCPSVALVSRTEIGKMVKCCYCTTPTGVF